MCKGCEEFNAKMDRKREEKLKALCDCDLNRPMTKGEAELSKDLNKFLEENANP